MGIRMTEHSDRKDVMAATQADAIKTLRVTRSSGPCARRSLLSTVRRTVSRRGIRRLARVTSPDNALLNTTSHAYHASAATAATAAASRSTAIGALLAGHVLQDGELVILMLKPSRWYVLLNPQFGLINAILKGLGLVQSGQSFLYQSSTALPAVILVTAWRLFPMATLLLLAGLQGISREQYEAAGVDGANTWNKFRHVTLPNLATLGIVVGVLLTIWSFKLFTVIYVLTAGGPGSATETLAIYSYEQGFKFYNLGTGSTVAMLMVVVSAVLVGAYFSLLRRNES